MKAQGVRNQFLDLFAIFVKNIKYLHLNPDYVCRFMETA